MHIIDFYYKNISRCTVLWMSNLFLNTYITTYVQILCTLNSSNINSKIRIVATARLFYMWRVGMFTTCLQTRFQGPTFNVILVFAMKPHNYWRRNFFKILAHPVYKMWITQEPKKVALWNKRHFEEGKKRRVCSMFKIFCTYICWIIYKMQHLEVSGAVRHI